MKHKKHTSVTTRPKVTSGHMMTLHTSLRKQQRALESVSTPATNVRVVGGGGVTNTAVNKEEKRAGYSPSKVKPFDL